MLRRSNKGKNQTDKPINEMPENSKPSVDESHPEATMSREEFIMHNEDARKVYDDILRLRKSVADLKQTGVPQVHEEIMSASEAVYDKTYLKETEDIVAAKRAVFEQAVKDAQAEKARKEELARKEEEARLQQQKVLEAQRRAALIEEEAERKRKQAEEAERAAKEVARRAALEAMEAERKLSNTTPEEVADFFSEEVSEEKVEANLEDAKQALIAAQRPQEVHLDRMSTAAGRHTMKLAAEQQQKLNQQQELIKSEQEEVAAILDDQKEQRLERLVNEEREKLLYEQKLQAERAAKEAKAQEERAAKLAKAQAERAARLAKAKAEKEARAAKLLAEKQARAAKLLAEKEAKAAKMLAEREARAAKLLAEREERRIKEEKRKAERIRKAEERELIKKAKRDAEARAQLERLRLEAKSKADAELGGGIVNVQGMTINTEIKEVAHLRLRDLFSLRTKKERKTESKSEKRQLERERRARTEEARKLLEFSLIRKRTNYEKTAFAKKIKGFYAFCEKHKAGLLTAFAVVLVAIVATAGVFNYYTAYAYSYNGKTLGMVKEKDDVLRITDLVQGALTEDKNVDVIIDARKDIEFERVWTDGEADIDTSEDVLKRLTYMGDLNVKAYCIFIDGKKIGAVEDKSIAEEVFREIEQKYTSQMEKSKIEKIEILEKWETKEDNISLDKVVSKDEMVDLLCTSGQKESLHTVVAGETLADIAKTYSTTEEDILKDNPNVDKKKLIVGDKLVIKQEAPILTVRITEKVTYEKVIEHKVKKKDSEDIYEGYSETQQTGEDGLSEVTSRIVLVNGEQIEETPLVTTVKKEPVTEIILVGIKERPPSVGSGKYIWPLEAGKYTITSKFGPRWGRFHYGLDMGIPTGNKVLAADGGIVTKAGYSGGYGYLVTIDHQNGMETRYAHNSQILVSVGDEVFQGMEIAKSGNTGNSTGPHLHFEVRVNGEAKNPLHYLP